MYAALGNYSEGRNRDPFTVYWNRANGSQTVERHSVLHFIQISSLSKYVIHIILDVSSDFKMFNNDAALIVIKDKIAM